MAVEIIGIGEIEDDEEKTLYDEIDRMFELHGDRATGEEFVTNP